MAPQSPVVVWGWVFLNDFDSEHKDVNDFLIGTKSNINSARLRGRYSLHIHGL